MKKTIEYANGDKYIGEVNNDGKPHGKGILHFTHPTTVRTWKCRYEGDFVDGKMQGKGVLCEEYAKMEDGVKREGDFVDGKLHGYGKRWFKGHLRYEGEWQNGREHGAGTVHSFPLLGYYIKCTWKEGKRHGLSTTYYVSDNSIRYEANYDMDKAYGRAVYYPREDKYFPDVVKQEGECDANGDIYKGTLYYTNGDRYEGMFFASRLEGKGVYIYADGTKEEREYDFGERIT